MGYLGDDKQEIRNKKTGETKVVSSKDLSSYGIRLSDHYPPHSSTLERESFIEKAANVLPAAGGIGGAIGGAAIGSVVEPGGGTIAGGIMGGGVGQAAGEWLRELIRHQPANISEITRQGIEGSIYGAIPEVKGARLISRVAKRSVVGAGISASVQAVEETGLPSDTWSRRIERIAKQGGWGAVAFPSIDAVISPGIRSLRYLGEKIPEDIYSYVQKNTAETLNRLHETAQGWMVGHNFVDYALKNKILPEKSGISSEIIRESLTRGKNKAKEINGKIDSFLDKSGVHVPMNDMVKMVEEARVSARTPNQGNQLANRLYLILKDLEQTAKEVPLKIVHEMKKEVGKTYNGMEKIYNTFQTNVERLSGNPEVLHALNQEAEKLVNINSNLEARKYSTTALPFKITPQGIEKSVKEATKGNPASLQNLVNVMGLGGLAVVGGSVKGLLGGSNGLLGGFAVMFGLRKTLDGLIQTALESPEQKVKVADYLSDWFQKNKNFAEKVQIAKAIEQLGLRTFTSLMQSKVKK